MKMIFGGLLVSALALAGAAAWYWWQPSSDQTIDDRSLLDDEPDPEPAGPDLFEEVVRAACWILGVGRGT